MYLSRVELDLNNRSTLKALGSQSIIHGAVESSFSGERKRNLWRIDKLGDKLYLLILSEDKPCLSSISSQFGNNDSDAETRNYDTLLNRVKLGGKWRFRLTANPTKSVSSNGGRGKVHAITIVDLQKQWLAEKSEKCGFKLADDSFDVVENKWCKFRKKDGSTVSLLSVSFEGVLEITDEELFKASLTNGIGRGKAYGMGLLTVIRT